MIVKYVSDIKWKSNDNIIYWTYRCEDTLELWELGLYYISLSMQDLRAFWSLDSLECKLVGTTRKFNHFLETKKGVKQDASNPQKELRSNKNLVFDSNFESGNLELAETENSIEYNLQMTVDTNTRGHSQWFYFCVTNM